MRLVYKTFLAFLATALAAVVMIAVLQVYLSHRFGDYLNQAALETMDDLVAELADVYRVDGNWTAFASEPDRWRATLRRFGSQSDPESKERQGVPSGGDLPEAAAQEGERPDETTGQRLPSPYRWMLKGLVLFDSDRKAVAGRLAGRDPATYAMREIRVDGVPAGWVGLPRRERPHTPLEADFRKAQSRAFLLVGGGVLLLVGLASLLFSKHILRPIGRLAKGTRLLADFDFDARIEVDTRDELGQLAEDFNRMAETLRKYEEMRRQWVADISHELRTPLAVLRGEIEALQDGIRKANRDTLQSLHAEIVRLGKMVDDLHLLSLADSQALMQHDDPVRPVEVLEKAAAGFLPLFDGEGIALSLDVQGCRDFVTQGDEHRLAQLYGNLLENTLRYTDAPGRLTITGREEGGQLVLCFEDTPPGVPEEALGRLFDRLYRVDKSRSRELGGSGLGLAICRQIVLAHGGEIHAEHSPAGGLLIRMIFPRAPKRAAGSGEKR
ncbi:Signal transduction histidine kinase [uncultured Desulfatiglans sp.]|nr:Signal transduction histidine kinase [uncultured Desulfatiglans sp.]